MAVPAASVSVAVASVESLAVAPNVVVSHPTAVVLASTAPRLNVGSTRVMLSLPLTSGVLRVNVNAMLVAPSNPD